MFDKLVESRPVGSVRSRRNYFTMTTLAMSVISLTGVVVSIFADDYSLNATFELSELIAPVEMAQVAPEQPQPRQSMPRMAQSSAVPTREIAQARVDNTSVVPTTISTTPNTHLSIPPGQYTLGPRDSGLINDGSARDSGPAGGAEPGTGLAVTPSVQTPPEEETAPPRRPAEPKVISKGVITGEATYLPKPIYPPAAQAVSASGSVNVQVLIDENGRVVSAHAASGNPLLRAAAERAALAARFTPTKLSDVPVKVTGIITYNFVRG